ncbi:MAG: hypothetical protein AAGI03_01910 [Pseudomonadota bacterium]
MSDEYVKYAGREQFAVEAPMPASGTASGIIRGMADLNTPKLHPTTTDISVELEGLYAQLHEVNRRVDQALVALAGPTPVNAKDDHPEIDRPSNGFLDDTLSHIKEARRLVAKLEQDGARLCILTGQEGAV